MSKGKIFLILALIFAAIFLVVPLFSSDKPQEYTLTITAQHCDVQVLNSKNKPVESLFEGQKYSIRVTPETGYEVTGIYSNGYRVNNHQITPTSDVLLRVDTSIKTYQLTLNSDKIHVYDSKDHEVTTVTHFEEYKITAPCDGYYYYNLWITYDDTVDIIESDIYYWTCDGAVTLSCPIRDTVKTTLSFAFPENGDYIYYTDYNANYVQDFNTQELSVYGFVLPENYRFVGWATEPDSTEIAFGAHTEFKIPFEANPYILYAVIEPIIYTLNYWSMDGQTLLHSVSNHGPTELTLVDYVDYATINEGYMFKGWSNVALPEYGVFETGESFTLDKDYDLYASIAQIDYYLNYYQSVDGIEPLTYTTHHYYFDEFTLRPISEFALVENGVLYNFLGWDTDPSADMVVYPDCSIVSKLTIANGTTVTLYAVWEPIIATLSLYAPDETTLLYSKDFAGLQQTTTLPAYSSLVTMETGKYFYNWKQLNGLNYYQDGAQIAMTNDISLAAVLQNITYKVTLNTTTLVDDVVHATELTLDTCTYGQTYTLPLASTLTTFAKAGFDLVGWDTDSSADSVVYADGAGFSNLTTTHNSVINLYAVYEAALPVHSKTFSANTPEQISAVSAYISENNLTSQQVYDTFGWSLGDKKPCKISNSFNRSVLILGFNHDTKTDGTGKAGITLMFDGEISYTDSSGGSSFNEVTYLNQLPDGWADCIVAVDKLTVSVGNISSGTTTSSSRKLFSLAYCELYSSAPSNYPHLAKEGSQYELFASVGSPTSYLHENFSSGGGMRSVYASSKYCRLDNTGNGVTTGTSKACTIIPAFCV